MEPPIQGDEGSGLDRRAVIRRGAILGGALVWTAPAVQTIAGPAFAAGSPTPCTVPNLIVFADIDGNGEQDPATEPCLLAFKVANTPECCACYTTGGSNSAALAACLVAGTCSATPTACP